MVIGPGSLRSDGTGPPDKEASPETDSWVIASPEIVYPAFGFRVFDSQAVGSLAIVSPASGLRVTDSPAIGIRVIDSRTDLPVAEAAW